MLVKLANGKYAQKRKTDFNAAGWYKVRRILDLNQIILRKEIILFSIFLVVLVLKLSVAFILTTSVI